MPNEDVADIPAAWRDLHLAANCAGPLASAPHEATASSAVGPTYRPTWTRPNALGTPYCVFDGRAVGSLRAVTTQRAPS
jgi:hypothetical protein